MTKFRLIFQACSFDGNCGGRAFSEAIVRHISADFKQRYRIDDADIIGHCDACSTCCPGRNFPWAEFRRRISE